ncbi:MAG: STAS domain-containing protein [Nitrospirales bacterium]|nr:STAS domain-containing protein [Nitrospirales bacterium]MDR4484807.1 STAS domain-containing protein [Nitrospirales bacterium]
MSTMHTQPTPIDDMHVITFGTCFDGAAEPALEAAVFHVQEIRGKHIILNMEALTTLNSRALGKLFLTYHHLNRKHIRLSVVNPKPAVRELLAFVNFPHIVPIYDSVDAVVASEQRQMEISALPQHRS